jgi:hypothetical protein
MSDMACGLLDEVKQNPPDHGALGIGNHGVSDGGVFAFG